jgi:hypothetical protein
MAQTMELLKAMQEMLQEMKDDIRTKRKKVDANNEKFEVL